MEGKKEIRTTKHGNCGIGGEALALNVADVTDSKLAVRFGYYCFRSEL